MLKQEMMFDWNADDAIINNVEFVDETIRDGLQSPFSPYFSQNEKENCLLMMDEVGIQDVIIGMLSEKTGEDDILPLLEKHREEKLKVFPWVLLRSDRRDVEAALAVLHGRESTVGVNLFINLCDLRLGIEGWTVESQIDRLTACLSLLRPRFARIRVAFEDATRSRPAALETVIAALAPFTINRLAIADTAGVCSPAGATAIVRFAIDALHRHGARETALEWHGHNDRGMAVACSLAALHAGCTHVHGTILGIGERNGNAALDQIMINCGIANPRLADWDALRRYHDFIRLRFGRHLDASYPFLGAHSAATATGTHGAAIHKARLAGFEELARILFSPPSPVALATPPVLLVSHQTGRQGAMAALASIGLPADPDSADRVLAHAKALRKTLTATEMRSLLHPL